MRIGNLDSDRQVIVIAEIGNNHEGSFDVACEMVDRAAEAGVDAVKFQTYKTETFVAPTQVERYKRMQGFELTEDQFAQLAERAHGAGIKFISTPLDMPSAVFLNGIVDALKVASGDNTFYPLIEFVAGTDKPVIISTGFAGEPEIALAASMVEKARSGRKSGPELALLHCVSAYPVEPQDANLGAVHRLVRRFGEIATIGYSDHTLGTQAATLSIAAGARIIEKHFTLDRNYSDFRDHQLSADPGMMADLVKAIREAEVLMGSGDLAPRQVERDSEVPVRRSIAAAREMKAGETVGPGDIMWIRPGEQIAPGREAEVLGRTLAKPVGAGVLFTKADFAA
jgi:N,N'-diacetyllegionaminate synthase